ncbi:MAG: HAD-IB family hydrolase [Deltaproteobacteria bacterium]|nr:HAD-IB family hydrolase [Deltaproteobacteria bacterium]
MLPKLEPAGTGAPVIAFFDMDLTLLEVNSAKLWLAFARREGRISRLTLLRGLVWVLRYRFGLIDQQKITEYGLSLEQGTSEAEMIELCERWYAELVRPTISRAAVARVEEHRAAGHEVVILTAATRYGAMPLARELELPLVCSEIEVVDGMLTGRHHPPLCYGEGKLERAREHARGRGAALEDCWFYTDSVSDLPVMEAMGHPVAVNADRPLTRRAREAGWPRVEWAGRG